MIDYGRITRPRPSAIEGIGLILDAGRFLGRPTTLPGYLADRIALRSDGYAFGSDLRRSMRSLALARGLTIQGKQRVRSRSK